MTTTNYNARLAETDSQVEIIDGAIELGHKLMSKYIDERDFPKAHAASDFIDALEAERSLLKAEWLSLWAAQYANA